MTNQFAEFGFGVDFQLEIQLQWNIRYMTIAPFSRPPTQSDGRYIRGVSRNALYKSTFTYLLTH